MVYTYPNSIHEAAKLLDIAQPNWSNLVNLIELNMKTSTTCILGQLYGHYWTGTEKLFGCKPAVSSSQINDTIFGTRASHIEWSNEITKRRNPEQKTMTAIEALQAMKDGKRVCAKVWAKGDYIEYKNGKIVNQNNYDESVAFSTKYFLNDNREWKIYEAPKLTLHDVKLNQRFERAGKIYTKVDVNGKQAYINKNGYVSIPDSPVTITVEKVYAM